MIMKTLKKFDWNQATNPFSIDPITHKRMCIVSTGNGWLVYALGEEAQWTGSTEAEVKQKFEDSRNSLVNGWFEPLQEMDKADELRVNLQNFLLFDRSAPANCMSVMAIGSRHQKKLWVKVGTPLPLIPAEFAMYKVEWVDGHFGLSFWNNRKDMSQSVPFIAEDGTVPTLI